MNRKGLVFLLLLLVFQLSLFATSLGFGGDLFLSSAFAFPRTSATSVEGPVARTSFAVDGNVNFFSLEWQVQEKTNLEVDAGLAFSYSSPSLRYGQTRLKPYTGLGVEVGGKWIYEGQYALGLKTRMLFSQFAHTNASFLVLDCSLLPELFLLKTPHSSFAMAFPITASLKADTITLRFGLGGSLRLSNDRGKEMKR